ncbi:winged helix-turn-helix domain-containing protein [Promethearchaeum syntrophicum]|uniref:Winged helix-turn-helix domain-containing protein n=1 Tax=Promethearchaeum syntrophicum TaxID=2594042 RepID=A0A5B9D8G5_9ARCH|nr:winged helix-turn-helix domain-containing protein [Candidatus Prometheoarchaeum syntrophicum]QEE15548.1 DNA-binding transcriptional repressor ArsR [Candidatus Prometheoarchaeum syntrophicum]
MDLEPELVKYFELLGDETKFGILFALKMFGSLNLKHIAKCLGKSEPAILRQLKILTQLNLIIIDQKESTQSWGKFYKISSYGSDIFSKSNKFINAIPDKEYTVNLYHKMSLILKSLSSFNHNITKFASNVYLEDAQRLVELSKKNEGNYGDAMIFSLLSISLKNKEDTKEYLEMVNEFQEKVKKFRVIKEIDEGPNQILYISSIPIRSIHPLVNKRESDDIYKK